MADQKISALLAVTAPSAADVLPIVSGGATKKVAVSDLAQSMGVAWAAWTPTWTNLTLGNGVAVAKFVQIGKLVMCRLSLVFGTTTSISGSVSFSLPVTRATFAGTAGVQPIGFCRLFDLSPGATYDGVIVTVTTTTGLLTVYNSAGTYASGVAISSTVPFTWATGDEIALSFSYEAA